MFTTKQLSVWNNPFLHNDQGNRKCVSVPRQEVIQLVACEETAAIPKVALSGARLSSPWIKQYVRGSLSRIQGLRVFADDLLASYT
jgi:hypothetical protein